MTYDMQLLINAVTEKNAWAVAEEISLRVHGEPGPSETFLKCYVTTGQGDNFSRKPHT